MLRIKFIDVGKYLVYACVYVWFSNSAVEEGPSQSNFLNPRDLGVQWTSFIERKNLIDLICLRKYLIFKRKDVVAACSPIRMKEEEGSSRISFDYLLVCSIKICWLRGSRLEIVWNICCRVHQMISSCTIFEVLTILFFNFFVYRLLRERRIMLEGSDLCFMYY